MALDPTMAPFCSWPAPLVVTVRRDEHNDGACSCSINNRTLHRRHYFLCVCVCFIWFQLPPPTRCCWLLSSIYLIISSVSCVIRGSRDRLSLFFFFFLFSLNFFFIRPTAAILGRRNVQRRFSDCSDGRRRRRCLFFLLYPSFSTASRWLYIETNQKKKAAVTTQRPGINCPIVGEGGQQKKFPPPKKKTTSKTSAFRRLPVPFKVHRCGR